ncbi:uncharacterized protein LOC6527048 [Drosophila yakuba]|uniref:Uncharacterized protein, isoform A n=1 Tax=Drosophila yakuba TaxID=7245 RepID=B4P095_DROYA|nr:uncharacterized protein LOC6527048 [Drosophila yakuba]XP_015053585.1 uncharacterized protein LOC6527048 [Drosophila yakuba]EDW87853.1 uncharacterized protein Dyak_GE18414, isoform A [Drosophila yakuba]KRJ97444.1 uncharacterized protein Dyak_GE18414, isoform B [Drosophila yakuba]
MASYDMQPTPSQEELKRTESNKNEKNSEESRSMHVDSDAVVASSSESELRPSRSSVTKATRIPVPLFLGPSASSRIYSSVMVQRKSRTSLANQQMADDSGINLDCSMTEVHTPLSTRPSPMEQTMLDRIPATSSEMELQLEEEQTLRELQRVVAEMEADVALHDMDMQDLQPGDDEQDTHVPNEASSVGNGADSFDVDMEQLTETDTLQKTFPGEPENRLVYEELPAENLHMVQEEIAQKEEFSEIKETAVEMESVKEYELFEQLAEEPVEECTEIVQETPQEAVGGESDKSVPESVMEELEMVIGGSCESEQDRLIREQFEKGPETMDLKFHQAADEIVCIDTEPELVANLSRDGSVESSRGLVTLEELYDPEHNVEILRQLLQTMAEDNSEADTAPDMTESEQTEEKETEMEAYVETTEMDKEMDPDLKQTGKPLSILRRLMNHRILKFSYPILFCSLAFSLIYITRKE